MYINSGYSNRKYRGYIMAKEEDRVRLERMGIQVGKYETDRFVDCVAGEAALELLNTYHSEFEHELV